MRYEGQWEERKRPGPRSRRGRVHGTQEFDAPALRLSASPRRDTDIICPRRTILQTTTGMTEEKRGTSQNQRWIERVQSRPKMRSKHPRRGRTPHRPVHTDPQKIELRREYSRCVYNHQGVSRSSRLYGGPLPFNGFSFFVRSSRRFSTDWQTRHSPSPGIST